MKLGPFFISLILLAFYCSASEAFASAPDQPDYTCNGSRITIRIEGRGFSQKKPAMNFLSRELKKLGQQLKRKRNARIRPSTVERKALQYKNVLQRLRALEPVCPKPTSQPLITATPTATPVPLDLPPRDDHPDFSCISARSGPSGSRFNQLTGTTQIHMSTDNFFDLRDGRHTYEPEVRAVISDVIREMQSTASGQMATDVSAPQNDELRAFRLQWLLVAANRLETASKTPTGSLTQVIRPNTVTAMLEPCGFDFTNTDPHPDSMLWGSVRYPDQPRVGKIEHLLAPHLVVRRDNVWLGTQRAATELAHLYSRDQGSNYGATCFTDEGGRTLRGCQGNVFILVAQGAENIELASFKISGTQRPGAFYDARLILHKNHQKISEEYPAGAQRTKALSEWGLVMHQGRLSVTGPKSNLTVRNVSFENPNYRAIQVKDDLALLESNLAGAYRTPAFRASSREEAYEEIRKAACFTFYNPATLETRPECKSPLTGRPYWSNDTLNLFQAFGGNIGFSWMPGVYQIQGGTELGFLHLEGNRFSNLFHALIARGAAEGSIFRDNKINEMLDHGLYFSGASVLNTTIRGNEVKNTGNHAIKVAAHSIRPSPFDSVEVSPVNSSLQVRSQLGLSNTQIAGNAFINNGNGAIVAVGVGNVVSDNTFGDTDTSGHFTRWEAPHITLTTYGFGDDPNLCGFNNHTSDNIISGNRHLSGRIPLEIVLGKHPRRLDPACTKYEAAPYFIRDDRASSNNQILGPGHRVFVQTSRDDNSRRPHSFGPPSYVVESLPSNTVVNCPADTRYVCCAGKRDC